MSDAAVTTKVPVATSASGRLFRGQTAIDFYGRRKFGIAISILLIVATVVSLGSRGLNLGIDFEGGTSWDIPASDFTVDEADAVLADLAIDTEGSRIQSRNSDAGSFLKVQVRSLTDAQASAVRAALADAAGLNVDVINVNVVSASWGSDITNKALRALIIFLVVVAIFISLRFEWRMALAAIIAMLHDVVISVGLYSIFGFVVTPATVIAFLTILGYSLYDTIVVFDRVRENETRFTTTRIPFGDVTNVSMNQVLMRSANTSISSVLPVIALLVVGAGIFHASTLSEFAVALLLGMLTGTYSSIFVAAPMLAALKNRAEPWQRAKGRVVTGADLRELVLGGAPKSRRSRDGEGNTAHDASPSDDATAILQHAPRPRKRRRR